MQRLRTSFLSGWCLIASLSLLPRTASALDARGGQFLAFQRFSSFDKTPGERPREVVWTSPVIVGQIKWNELVASWNVDMPEGTYLKIEARGIYPVGPTKSYTMGVWSPNPARHPRHCVLDQADSDGDVSTDTLKMRTPCERFQARLTLGSDDNRKPTVKFLGIALTDTTLKPPVLPPNQAVWGTTLPVPERSQMVYPHGGVLCSPTTVSMIMAFWADKLRRPELDRDVPDIEKAIYDSNWKGTGNWPFNTAYAGSYRGLRAYVARMTDLSELEAWIDKGIPVGLSLCYNRLRGKGETSNGHLVVCVGFTEAGDPIINDPGTSQNVRKVFPRKNLVWAWKYSENAAYLIYPEGAEIPMDRFGHWDSWTARQRIRFE